MISSASKEKIFDIILQDALKESMKREFADADKITEGEPHKFSMPFERKMRKLIRSIGRKNRIKKCAGICVKAVITVSAVFGVISGGLLTRPDVYAAVKNVFRSVFEKYDTYEYNGESISINDLNNIRLGYIPDGYSFIEGRITPISYSLTFSSESGEIYFKYGIAEGLSTDIDNEHSSFSEFYLNGIEYYYYKSNDKDSYDTLIWYEDGYSFSIFAHLPKDELVKIAENIEK